MRTFVSLLAASSLLALAACDKAADRAPSAPDKPAAAAVDREADAAAASDSAAPSPARAVSPPAPVEAPVLALAYRYALILPADQVRPLMESHQEACERAGLLQCQVLGADARGEGRDKVSARLDLRATPAWMRAFRTRAEADARDAGGRVQGSGTVDEDLSRPIVDAEAAQRARAAERERLEALMQRRTRNLEDTLQVEQEITRVQGEMDAAASELAMMKGRIAMQTLTLEYQSKGMIAPDGVSAPIARASEDFLATMAMVFAALIRIAAVLTPFVIIGGPVVWFFTRRGKARKPASAP